MWKVENNQLVIQAHKCTLVLNQSEVTKMLDKHPDLFRQAIKRGKYHRRANQNRKRRVPHHRTFDPKVERGDTLDQDQT